MIADAIRKINAQYSDIKLVLNIYTRDHITKKQNMLLNDGKSSIIHGGVPGSELPGIYARADIALHVESFDLKNRLLTQDSFSTKVMDCMASGCAVMAVCWSGHSAGVYLKWMNAAMVANSYSEIESLLDATVSDPSRVTDYSKRAYECGSLYHDRQTIQKKLFSDFERIIDKC
jgi:hypothetical protein